MRTKLFLRYTFILSLLLIGFACKSKKIKAEFLAPNYIKVSFISIGSGTDGATRKQFLEFLDTYQAEQKITLEVNSWNWGREGEKDYCIKTGALSEKQYFLLKSKINEITFNNNLVRISEPDTCERE